MAREPRIARIERECRNIASFLEAFAHRDIQWLIEELRSASRDTERLNWVYANKFYFNGPLEKWREAIDAAASESSTPGNDPGKPASQTSSGVAKEQE